MDIHDFGCDCYFPHSRTNHLSRQETTFTWLQVDNSYHRQICTKLAPHLGRLPEAMGLGCTMRPQRFQHVAVVSSSPLIISNTVLASSSWHRPMNIPVRFLIPLHTPNQPSLPPEGKSCATIIGTRFFYISLVLLLISVPRVFLTGKAHVDYRRVLNTLFTRKALRYLLSDQLPSNFLLSLPCSACTYPYKMPWHEAILLNGLRHVRKLASH